MRTPPVTLEPFTPAAALQVLTKLDEMDQFEAVLMRGDEADSYELLAGWMALRDQGAACFVGWFDGHPIAVMAIVPGAVPGQGHAAMLACDHQRHKRALVALVRLIRDGWPAQARAMGLHRIEARSWAGHPTAPSLLRAIGFELEAHMVGFGQSGEVNLMQWVWLADYIPRLPSTLNKET